MALMISMGAPAFAQSTNCTFRQENAADRALGNVTTWSRLVDWRGHYVACDDASTAEGVSEIMARLLTTDWPGLMRTGPTIRRDRALHAFLVRHIDTTMSERDAKLVRADAATRCTSGNRGLCGDITKEIDALLTELHNG